MHQDKKSKYLPCEARAEIKRCCLCLAESEEENALLRFGYTEDELKTLLSEHNVGYGCGNGAAIAAIKPGEFVLDLGSGVGFDCFLARGQTGKDGYVIGVDMAPTMVSLSRSNLIKSGYTNVEFRLGEIEHLPVADNTMDVVLSNCVVNLSSDKQQVLREAYRVLKIGGRISLCDFLLIAPLPRCKSTKFSKYFCCLEGAVTAEQMHRMLQSAGFISIEMRQTQSDCLKQCLPCEDVEEYICPYCVEAIKGAYTKGS